MQIRRDLQRPLTRHLPSSGSRILTSRIILLTLLFFLTSCSAAVAAGSNKFSSPSHPDVPEDGIETRIQEELGEGFVHGFVASLSTVLVSEIGDKTFFIAAIMAMSHPRTVVFLGAISATFVVTAFSAALGFLATVIPKIYTCYLSAGLFAIFGFKMLMEGIRMKPEDAQEELEEVNTDLRRREEELKRNSGNQASKSHGRSNFEIIAHVFLQAFTMTFLSEWGDRSQISTIVLFAKENMWGVTLGGNLGNALCTGVAVIGGRMVAERISVKTVTIVGGIVFLLFAISSLF